MVLGEGHRDEGCVLGIYQYTQPTKEIVVVRWLMVQSQSVMRRCRFAYLSTDNFLIGPK